MSRFIVTGTGRSGTRFVAHLLREAGINCGHEDVFTFKSVLHGHPVKWGDWQADSSWMAVPFLHKINVPSILVVREPLAVVRSMLELGWFQVDKRRPITQIVYRFRPEIRSYETRPDKCLALWYHWNLSALPYVHDWVRLESVEPSNGAGLVQAAGGQLFKSSAIAAIRDDPVKANLKRDVPRETWDVNWEMFNPELARAALSMRYKVFGYGG